MVMLLLISALIGTVTWKAFEILPEIPAMTVQIARLNTNLERNIASDAANRLSTDGFAHELNEYQGSLGGIGGQIAGLRSDVQEGTRTMESLPDAILAAGELRYSKSPRQIRKHLDAHTGQANN